MLFNVCDFSLQSANFHVTIDIGPHKRYFCLNRLQSYRMAIIVVGNHKGGTGKTTTTLHMGAALSLTGKKTLLIDLDPQAFLTQALGREEAPPESSSLAFWMGARKLSDIPIQQVGKLHLIPASTKMTHALRKLNKPTDLLWIREVLEEGHDFDFILLDTAAAVTVYSLSALVAAQHLLIPVTPEYQPVVGAEQTYQTWKMVREKLNPRLHPPLFLFTRVDARKRSHFAYRKYLRSKYGDLVMKSIIRTSTSLSHPIPDGQTAFDRDIHSRGAIDYANATEELLQTIQAAHSAPQVA